MRRRRSLLAVSLVMFGLLLPPVSSARAAGRQQVTYIYYPTTTHAGATNGASMGFLVPLLTGIGFNLLQQQLGNQLPFNLNLQQNSQQPQGMTTTREVVDNPKITSIQQTIDRIGALLPPPVTPSIQPTSAPVPPNQNQFPSFFPQ